MIPALRASNADVPLYVDFVAELRLRGFDGDLSTGAGDRTVFATDNSIYQLTPQAIVFPRNATDVVRIMPLPSERDPVLLVHSNAVLPLPVSGQHLQTIAGNGRQVVQTLRRVEHRQLPIHGRPDTAGHTPRGLAVSLFPEVRGRGVRERLDHSTTIYGYRVSVNSPNRDP